MEVVERSCETYERDKLPINSYRSAVLRMTNATERLIEARRTSYLIEEICRLFIKSLDDHFKIVTCSRYSE